MLKITFNLYVASKEPDFVVIINEGWLKNFAQYYIIYENRCLESRLLVFFCPIFSRLPNPTRSKRHCSAKTTYPKILGALLGSGKHGGVRADDRCKRERPGVRISRC